MQEDKIVSGGILIDYQEDIMYIERSDGGRREIADFTLKRLGVGWDASPTKQEKNDGYEHYLMEVSVRHSAYRNMRITVPINVMSDMKEFTRFFGKYDGNFFGTGRDLNQLNSILKEQVRKEEQLTFHLVKDTCGRFKIGNKDLWVFDNGYLIDGKFVEESGEYQYEEGKALVVERGYERGEAPCYHKGISKSFPTTTLAETSHFFNSNTSAIPLILGFYAASLHYEDTMDAVGEGFFPILHVVGETSTGKTELFTNLFSSLVGTRNISAGAWVGTSKFVLEKSLSTTSHFPIIMDEFRERTKNTQKEAKDEILRSVYNRGVFKKGRPDLTMRTMRPVSTLVLMGQDSPRDAAVRNRCVSIYLGKEDVVSREEWGRIKAKALSNEFFQFFNYVVDKGINKEELRKDYRFFADRIKSVTRSASNYCMLLASFAYFFIPHGKDREEQMLSLASATNSHIDKDSEDANSGKTINDFFYQAEKAITRQEKYLCDFIIHEESNWYIHLSGLSSLMNTQELDEVGISDRGLADLLKNNYGALPVQKKINTVNKRTWQVGDENAPSCLNQDLIQRLQDEQFKKEQEDRS